MVVPLDVVFEHSVRKMNVGRDGVGSCSEPRADGFGEASCYISAGCWRPERASDVHRRK